MDTKTIDVVVGYTKQFIDAVTPIAKQAYEIGLLTLQIDAAQVLITAGIFFAVTAISIYVIVKHVKNAIAKTDTPENKAKNYPATADEFLPGGGVVHAVWLMLSISGFIGSMVNLLSVWTWIKLCNPSLWLAHQAVEKLLK